MATVLAADANGWIQHGHLIGHADAAADLVDERKSDAIEPGIRLGGSAVKSVSDAVGARRV